MAQHNFKIGDHVEWNSEAGLVQGTIKKKHTAKIDFQGVHRPRFGGGAAVFD